MQYLLSADDLGDAWPAVDVGAARDDGKPDWIQAHGALLIRAAGQHHPQLFYQTLPHLCRCRWHAWKWVLETVEQKTCSDTDHITKKSKIEDYWGLQRFSPTDLGGSKAVEASLGWPTRQRNFLKYSPQQHICTQDEQRCMQQFTRCNIRSFMSYQWTHRVLVTSWWCSSPQCVPARTLPALFGSIQPAPHRRSCQAETPGDARSPYCFWCGAVWCTWWAFEGFCIIRLNTF